MIGETLNAVAGLVARWRQQLYEADGITPYAGASPSWSLAARLWPGGGQPAVAPAPVASWDDADAGTYRLTIPAATSAGIRGGTYRLLVEIHPGGGSDPFPAFNGRVKFEGNAGQDAPIPAYGDYEDLLIDGSCVADLLDPEDGIADFARERGRAREDLDEAILAHAPASSTWGGLRGGSSSIGGRNPYLAGLLADDRLVVTSQVRRAVALQALALICRAEVSPKEDRYAAFAAGFQAEADVALSTLTAEIDTDGDGVGDLFIPLGTTNTSWG